MLPLVVDAFLLLLTGFPFEIDGEVALAKHVIVQGNTTLIHRPSDNLKIKQKHFGKKLKKKIQSLKINELIK